MENLAPQQIHGVLKERSGVTGLFGQGLAVTSLFTLTDLKARRTVTKMRT